MPLVCVVDDAQWLDRPSADALTFAARRLEAEGVVLLFAARDGEVRRFEAEGLAEAETGRCARDRGGGGAAGQDVTSHGSPEVRDRLVETAGGNRLALIELSGLLSAEQLAGRVALPDPLPQSTEIERVDRQSVRAACRRRRSDACSCRRGRRHRAAWRRSPGRPRRSASIRRHSRRRRSTGPCAHLTAPSSFAIRSSVRPSTAMPRSRSVRPSTGRWRPCSTPSRTRIGARGTGRRRRWRGRRGRRRVGACGTGGETQERVRGRGPRARACRRAVERR